MYECFILMSIKDLLYYILKNATTIISSTGRFVSNFATLYLGHYADKQVNELC